MTTLSLEASKKVFELIGEYETERYWCGHNQDEDHILERTPARSSCDLECGKSYPAPNFAELLRVLPRIGEKLSILSWKNEGRKMYDIFMDYESEPEGMKAMEEHLMKLLK